jgi:2-polyprenyl-3-methyl-5-hydroxy-6-metoxy-1,4-benzoquinol methylase
MQNWKELFYRNYVSSGQSQDLRPFRHYTRNLVQQYFPQDKKINILDIGCGTGASLFTIKKMGYNNLFGVDISDEQISIAHNFGLEFCRKADILQEKNIFDNSFFDVILLMDVLEHFNKNEIVDLLSICNALLRKGGILIIHVPNAEGIFGSKIRYADFTHEISFTQKSIVQLLRMTSFEAEVIISEDKPLMHSFKSAIRSILWMILTFPFRLLHFIECGTFDIKLSQNILVIAEK